MGCLDDTTIYDLVQGEIPRGRIDDVDAHIDSCERCREVVIATARTIGRDTPRLAVGERVGRHVVVGELGRGAFGVVYRAYDASLDRAVALKLMRTGTDPAFTERLRREAKAMAKLSHPNVVTVFEVGTSQRMTFIAMELVEGRNLRAWLKEEPEEDAIRDVFVQAALGLAAAHEAGIVHRDFKPDNVLVGRDGRPRVTDFGLARGVGDTSGVRVLDDLEGEDLATSLTLTGQLLGTPVYMAPEQLRGEVGDARSDQYSFCVSLFEALVGQRPFSGSNLAELRAAVLDGHAMAMGPAAPRWVARVIRRGMARDPALRFPSMRALAQALRLDPSTRWRWGFGAVAVAAAVVATSVSAARGKGALCDGATPLADATWNDERAQSLQASFAATGAPFAKQTAGVVGRMLAGWKVEWVQAHRQTCEATRIHGEQSELVMNRRMACLSGQKRRVDALVSALSGVDAAGLARAVEAVGELESPSACDSEVVPIARGEQAEKLDADLAEATALVAVGRYRAAADRARKIVDAALAMGDDVQLSRAHGALADALRRRGDLDEAERSAHAGLWAARRAGDWRREAGAWLRIAAIAGHRGHYEAAAGYCHHAESALHHSGDPRLFARLHSAIAVVSTHLGELDDARHHLRSAKRIRAELDGVESTEMARLLTTEGNLARVRGDYGAAIAAHEEARRVDAKILGDAHPNAARHGHNLARAHLLRGDVEKAEALYLSALELKRTLYGPSHPEVGVTENSLGLLRVRGADDVQARTHFEAALAAFGATRPLLTAMTRANLGVLHLRENDFGAALANLEPALVTLEKELSLGHVRSVMTLEAIAMAHAGQGDRALAISELRKARVAASTLVNGDVLVSRIDATLKDMRLPSETDEQEAASTPVVSRAIRPRPVSPAGPAPRPDPKPLPPPLTPPQPKPVPPKPPKPKPKPKPKPGGAYMPDDAWE